MSFDFNLSSDDDEEESTASPFIAATITATNHKKIGILDNEEKILAEDEAFDSDLQEDPANSLEDTYYEQYYDERPSDETSHEGIVFPSEFDANDDEDEDDDSVDWEDAEEDPAPQEPQTTSNPKPVTLDLGPSESEALSSQAKRKRPKTTRSVMSWKYDQQSPELRFLLHNLHKTSLLVWVGHAKFASSFASDPLSLAIAHSVLPTAWWVSGIPTNEDVSHFVQWFDNYALRSPVAVKRSKRRSPRKRGTKNTATDTRHKLEQYCTYLQDRRANPRDRTADFRIFSRTETIGLFLSMVRSMGWRARYVVAAEPISRDLDVHHPLFSSSHKESLVRLFRSLKSVGVPEDAKPQASPQPTKSHPEEEHKREHLCWVEILCMAPAKRASRAPQKKSPSMQWIHVDPVSGVVDKPSTVEESFGCLGSPSPRNRKRPISYAVAAEHFTGRADDLSERLTDVTRRYASSMVNTMDARGLPWKKQSSKPKRRKTDHTTLPEERPDVWLSKLLRLVNSKSESNHRTILKSKGKTKQDAIAVDTDSDEETDKNETSKQRDHHKSGYGTFDMDRQEEAQLEKASKNEPLPTSKAAFKKHPLYVIRSVLNSTEVLKPDAKARICGMFKGELVYFRSDVETALTPKRWLYEGRKVRESELQTPALRVKARKKPVSKGFKALKSYGVGDANDGSEASRAKEIQKASEPLGDGKESLYGSWQTDPWGPTPVGPNDPIPVNDYNNIELELLNPGLVHVELHHIAKVAKKLSLPYAPCLLGFEGNRGNRTPTIRGIVVHAHNEELLREAHAEMADHLMREETEKKEKAILLRWKRILVGVLTKDRLEREYGEEQKDG